MTAAGFAWADALGSLAVQLAWFQAALLGAAAVHKILGWPETRRVALQFAGFPRALAGWASGAAVGVELAAAVALVVPATRTAGAVGVALLWSLYLGLLVRALLSGRRDVDCGCSFGARTGGNHRPVGAFQIARTLALVAMAVVVALVSARGRVDAAASQGVAAAALLALYAALDQVMALPPLRRGEVS